MKTSRLVLVLLWLGLSRAPFSAPAQVVADGTTNTLSNITNAFTGDVTVGTNGSFTLLVLSDNALLTNSANGVIGRNATARSNEVRLLTPSARWLMGNHLFVGNDGSFNRLVVSNGGTVWNNTGFLGPNASGSNNVAVVTGPGSVWSNANVFYLGFNGAGNQLMVSNGGVLRARVSNAGVNSSSSNNVAVVTGSGSLWSNAFELQFGFNGAGNQLVISNGGVVRSSLGYIGTGASASNNVVLVTGSGSLWSNTTDLYVGHSGAGNRLVVSDGGAARNGHGYVGANTSGSNNLALVTGPGSVWSNALDLEIGGFSGNNRMIVSNGATVFAAGNGFIGPTTNGSANSVVVAGPATRWLIASNLYVGSNGALSRLAISNGAFVGNGLGTIGQSAPSSNNVAIVTGFGSVWSNASTLYVGFGGRSNQLLVSDGAVVRDILSYVGFNSASGGNLAAVTGPGSLWSNAFELYLGFGGAGNHLVVSNGGLARNSIGTVGLNASSSNNVAVVTGPGSLWSNTFEYYLGFGSAGNRLVVSDGGAVHNSIGTVGNSVSSSNNAALVTGTGSVWSNALALFIGRSGAQNHLVVSDGATVSAGGHGSIGHNTNANANTVTVTDPGTSWLLSSNLYVGSNGAFSTLIVSNGALVKNDVGSIGSGRFSSNNFALVTGSGSMWSNASELYVGRNGQGNQVVVSHGGIVRSAIVTFIGGSATSSNNVAIITGPVSLWKTPNLFVGSASSGNRVVVTNGGQLDVGLGTISSSDNEVLVTGAGSSWINPGSLNVGVSGSRNRLLVRNGGEVRCSSNIRVGVNADSTNNRVVVDGGTLRATNFVGTGILDVRGGTNLLNAGLVDADRLVLTNAQGFFEFNGGTLLTRSAVISNGEPFVVGRTGAVPAVWDVRAGPNPHAVLASFIVVGENAPFCQLLVTNGALLSCREAVIGNDSGSHSNQVIVSSPGSRLEVPDGDFYFGNFGSFNTLVISNGGRVTAGFPVLGAEPGSTNNQAVVTGSDSRWAIRNTWLIGQGGAANRALIADGATVVVSNLLSVGHQPATSSNNLLHVANGALFVTNGAATGTLDIRSGTNRLDAGLIDVDRLVITNARGIIEFNGGTLRTAGTTIGTGRVLTVGNGTSAATLELRGGTHVFLGGLVVANHASLTGNGTVPGTLAVQPGGQLAPGASVGKIVLDTSPSLQGTVIMEITKDGPGLTNDQIQVTTALTYGGSLIVSNLGPAVLAAGDRYRLFSAAGYSGSFSGISLPRLPAGLNWSNKLLADGSLEVVPWSGPRIGGVAVSGTNLTFTVTEGFPGGAYDVLTSTNVTLPLANWSILNSGTFDWLGTATVTNGIEPGDPARFFAVSTP